MTVGLAERHGDLIIRDERIRCINGLNGTVPQPRAWDADDTAAQTLGDAGGRPDRFGNGHDTEYRRG